MHPELLSMSLFMFVTSCSPGPNNIVASYSGFNFGLIKTIPHMCGVIFGFTTLVIVVNFGLINVFKNFPIIQEILKYGGTIFLIYLAYKISFSKTSSGSTSENPVKFIETFFFSIFESKRSYCSDNNCFNLCRKWKTLYKLFFMGNCRCIFFCMCKYYFLDFARKIFK